MINNLGQRWGAVLHRTDALGTAEAANRNTRPRGGRRLRWRETAGFLFSEAVYPGRSCAPHHEHELAGLAVVLEGSYQKRMRRATYECRPGTLTLEPPGIGHAESYGTADARVLLIEIMPERLATVTDRLPSFPEAAFGSHPSVWQLGGRMALELQTPDASSSLALEGLALELIATAARLSSPNGLRSSTQPAWLRRIIEHLRDDFRADLPVHALAAEAGVHPTHLARVFRAHEGCSLGEFVRQRRIEWAAVQLATTPLPLSTVAQLAGFYDQSHFTRVFGARMGMSPGRYRTAARAR